MDIGHKVRDQHTKLLTVVVAILTVVFMSASAVLSQEKPSRIQECSSEPASSAVFEDDWIRAAAPAGWSECPPRDAQSPRAEPLPGALFRKDDFKLFLLTHAGHASPVEGGRFVEVVPYLAPWTDTEEGECGLFLQGKSTKVTNRLSRVDSYFDALHASKDALEACGNPESKAVFWYGSRFAENCPPRSHIPSTEECGGFFIGYPRIAGRRPKPGIGQGMMMFILTFDTKDPDYLPSRGDPELEEMLKEATAIVRNIRYK
jgi:hypothetical protein